MSNVVCIEHDWPAELDSDARCANCGLEYGQWTKEETSGQVADLDGRLMAYQGKPGCTSMQCRRFFNADGSSGACMGWHCADCHEPSSQYGHDVCMEEVGS